MNYEIKRFEMIQTAKLTPHPDAEAYPHDDDDRAALDASIGGVGVLEPLTVTTAPRGEFLVIDGCGRLEEAVRLGTETLPCLVVTCDDVRNFAANKNAMGRKRSTGSRILCYLMANIKAVCEASRASDRSTVSRDTVGRTFEALPSNLAPWTSKQIASRLKVSNKDVVSAIQLIVCQTQGQNPSGEELDEEARRKLDDTFRAVMCARTPIRRWAAAFAGKRVPVEGCGRAAVNLPERARRTLVALVNVFADWSRTEWCGKQDRVEMEGRLAEALEIMPECARAAMADIIGRTWNAAEKKNLAKMLASK